MALTAGMGVRRPKPRKEERAKMGTEGEDTVEDGSGEAGGAAGGGGGWGHKRGGSGPGGAVGLPLPACLWLNHMSLHLPCLQAT